ncbi:hypothetical protein IKF81_01610 [Candidatus Saccharibacteria bacterium]|nr:hypothetical protein [Candidatus Saccharibacteria bacterium]
MLKNKKIEDKHRIGLAATIFIVSTAIIIGHYWLFDGYFWNCSMTLSKYVAQNLWSVIIFGASNLIISAIFIDFIRNTKGYKTLWYVDMYAMVAGLIGISLFPDGLLNTPYDIHWTAYVHNVFAGIMFTSMIIAACIALKNKWKKILPSISTTAYIIYSLAFMITFALDIAFSVSYILIWELLFLTAFYAIIGSTKTRKHPIPN